MSARLAGQVAVIGLVLGVVLIGVVMELAYALDRKGREW